MKRVSLQVEDGSWLRELPWGVASRYAMHAVEQHVGELRRIVAVLDREYGETETLRLVESGALPIRQAVKCPVPVPQKFRPFVETLWVEVEVSKLQAAELLRRLRAADGGV